MDDFSRADRLRALWSPLCCCIPAIRLSGTTGHGERDGQGEVEGTSGAAEREWYAQSGTNGQGDGWDDAVYEGREADALSLHEGVGGSGGTSFSSSSSSSSSSRPRRRIARGGDITGGGADTGSGLTRWMLLKSWWRGNGEGRIRLPESEDEGATDVDGLERTSRFSLGDGAEGDADAVPLQFDDVVMPPAPPPFSSSTPHPSSASPGAPEASDTPLSPVPSEGTTLVDAPSSHSRSRSHSHHDDPEREARRAARRARRRARELGISIEAFEAGVAAGEPEELPHSPFLDVQAAPPRSRKGQGSSRSSQSYGSRSSGSSASGSRGKRELSVVGEEEPYRSEEGADEPKKHHRRHRSGRREKERDGGSSRGSRDGEVQPGPGLEAHLSPLPVSPSYAPSSYSEAADPPQQHSSSRSSRHREGKKHRSHPSISTDSTLSVSTGTGSSTRRSHRSRRHRDVAVEELPPLSSLSFAPPPSPLHALDSSAAAEEGQQFYEDEHGQLRPYGEYYAHHEVPDVEGGEAVSVAAPLTPAQEEDGKYAHIGVLPPASTSAHRE
ncbi:hypothetical protein JCM10213_000341 [Rhodosporidiobolus nylandii]